MKRYVTLFLFVALLLIFSSSNDPSFSGTDVPSSPTPSASSTEDTPIPAPQKIKISLTPPVPLEEDSRHLFERGTFDADFYGFSKDGKYFVANFEKEGIRQKEGSYLFFVGRELKVHEEEKLDLSNETMVLLRENQVCNIYEIYSLHYLEDDPTYGTLALRQKRKAAVGGDVTYITLLHYVKQPLEDYPLVPPDPISYVPNPYDPLTEWLEWLCFEDMGGSSKYPWVNGNLYDVCDYDGFGPLNVSAWELWPYVDFSVEPQTRFHLNLMLNRAELDAFSDLGTDDYPYEWVTYYRPKDSTENFKMAKGGPWGTCPIGDYIIYRLPLMDYGCEMSLNEDGSTRAYHMVFFLLDKNTDEIVAWNDQYVDWTDSSEAYYKDALKHGLIRDL